MKKAIEKYAAYLLLGGFIAFGTGMIVLVIEQSLRNGLPMELTLILLGLTLIVLGIFAAKIFGDIPDERD